MTGRRGLATAVSMAVLVLAGPAGSDQALQVLGRDAGAGPARVLAGGLLTRLARSIPERRDRRPGPPAVPAAFPIRSGLVPSAAMAGMHRVDLPLTRPVCVLGSDRISRRWLQRNRRRLAALGASCLLVQADSRHEVETVRRLARGVPVQPATFGELSRLTGIATVPMLLVGRSGLP